MNSVFLKQKNRKVVMKRFSAVLIIGLVISAFSFAQTQTGNASYNPSKPGIAISHPSLSFNTRVRVTNLRNNRSVEATVNGRIPISAERIADISRDAGDALGLDKTAMTLVEIEVLPPRETASAPPPAENAAPGAPEPPRPAPAPSAPAPQRPSPPPDPAAAEPWPVQTITDVRYIPVPAAPQQSCSCGPLLVVILLLLILVIILLLAILILLLRRLLLWPWHYPVWYRRHLLYAKKRRQ
jgi:rare lipoprotein A